MIYPDYDRSILSVTASVLAHYGVKPAYPTLPELDKALAGKKKVLWLIADGLGSGALRRTLPEGAYLRRNTRATVTSVFPATTTAAITAYYSGKSPLEHGWLGWHLYFKEYAADVTTFTSVGYYSTSKHRYAPSPATTLMPYKTIFELVRSPELVTHSMYGFPTWCENGADYPHRINTLEQGCALMKRIAEGEDEAFALMYWTQPDADMHAHGVDSTQARAQYKNVNDAVERLSAQIFRDGREDTLLLVTSDHGLTDVDGGVELTQDPEVMDMLLMPPSIESRAAAIFLKPGRLADFRKWFEKKLAEDFLLVTREEALASGIFGRGTPHPKSGDFIGDALLIATGRRYLEYTVPGVTHDRLRGRHAGLTADEMLVDIIIDTGENT